MKSKRTPIFSRRAFLGTWAAGSAWLATGGSRRAEAIEPLERSGTKFKFSLAAYSYRNLLSGQNPALTLFDFVDDCAAFGLEGTELTSYYFPENVDAEYLHRLKGHCFRQGLDVSGTAVGNNFGFPPGEQRNRQIAQLKRWIEFAAILGAPVIRIFAGHQQEGVSSAESHRLMVAGIEECCQTAGEHGVHLALENHGGPTATAAGLLKLVRDVQSPWFGVNLDTGNFRSEDLYAEIEQVAPYALNVQVKVAFHDAAGHKRPTDFRRLAEILRKANYRGYIVLEYEESEDPRSESRRYLDLLRDAFAE